MREDPTMMVFDDEELWIGHSTFQLVSEACVNVKF